MLCNHLPRTLRPSALATAKSIPSLVKERAGIAGRCFFSSGGGGSLPQVGFIGLGNMGLPMSINLAKKGVSVLAFDTDAGATANAKSNGIRVAASCDEIGASDCQVVVTMLPGCDAVHRVMNVLLDEGKDNSSSTAEPPRVFVDCSTVSPTTSRHWHEVWQAKGHFMLDAPVSGGVKGATDGTLTFMVGFPAQEGALEKARPYLEIMGQRVVPCGGPGAGSATKLCNNLALACQMIGICEAMNLGEALDVDPVVLADVMNQSTAKCWSCEVNNPHPAVALAKSTTAADGTKIVGPPASRDYQGGFGTKLMLKDLGLAVDVAQQVSVAMPLTATAKELYRIADAGGLGSKDFGVMLQFLRGK